MDKVKRVGDLVQIKDLEPGEAFIFDDRTYRSPFRHILHEHVSDTHSRVASFSIPASQGGEWDESNESWVRRAQPDLLKDRILDAE